MSGKPLKVVFAGTPDFAVPTLESILNSQHRVIAVYTQPDRPAGRGRQLQASPVKQCALQNGLALHQPLNFKDSESIAVLQAQQPDVMVVVAYGLILPQAVLDIPRFGCLNVHASLLPRWRGAAPIQRAVLAGDMVTGVSIMQMDAGLDTGDVLLRRELPITDQVTAAQLHDQLAVMGAASLVEVLDSFAVGQPPDRMPQEESLATYAHKLSKAEAEIDWSKSAQVLARMVRAFNPWPVAYTNFQGQPLRVWKASVAERVATQPAGHLEGIDNNELAIATGEGVLLIQQLQPAGKRIMTSGEFIQARRQQLNPGMQIG